MLPKLIITDIDGVWTDGSMYYDQTGNELKRFHTYDSAGVLFAHMKNIPVAVITGEDTDIVARRAKKVKVDYLFQGIKDKVQVVENLINDLKINYEDCAFIGDDINDILLMRKVGFSAATKNAPKYIKKEVDYVTKKKGGEGAFREFVEHLLQNNGLLEVVLKEFIISNQKSN